VPITHGINRHARDDRSTALRGHPEHERLLQRLETSYEVHTRQLARLTIGGGGAPDEADTRDHLVDASRRAVADIAAALRHMAEGNYGRCERCGKPIPVELLEARPETRDCGPCQGAALADPPGST